jgi:anaerobic selenocysteine-containing dehydrogenase
MTAAAADLFLPCTPGTEGIVALGIAHVMVRDRLTPASAVAGRLSDDLSAYSPEAVERVTGVHAHDIAAVAEEFARNQPGIAIPGTGAATGPDGAFHCGAVALLNVLAGNVGKPGGVSFPNRALAFAKYGAEAALLAPSPESGYAGMRDAIEKMRGGAFRMAILSGATNPAFTLPPSLKFSEALSKVPFVVAFTPFLDETTSQADLVLPVPTALEAWGDDLAPVGHSGAVTLCQPVVTPFHDARSMPDVLIAAAGELGGEPAKALPWGSFKECLDKSYGGPGGEMEAALQRGGFLGESSSPRFAAQTGNVVLPKATERPIDGDPKEFPLALHLYPSVTLYDGRGANLPWLQEMPDPITTAVWRNWVEVNPKTGARLGLSEGDGVTVTSPSGKITAHVTFNPGVAPDVAAMPLGQGHTRYGKTANGRGENPFALLPAGEMYALQATRVALTKAKLSTRLVRFAHPEGQWKISNLM